MPKHKVKLTFDVPYYGDVEVDAPTPEQARLQVRQALSQGQELLHPLFKKVRMEPDILDPGMVTVLTGEEPQPPKRKKTKRKKRPTFRDNG